MFYCQECGPDLRITKVRKVGEKEMPSQKDVALWCYMWPRPGYSVYFGSQAPSQKKVQEPKKKGREKGRKGDKRKERRRRKQIWDEKSKERSRKEKKGASYTKPNQTVGAKKNRKRKGKEEDKESIGAKKRR